MSIFEVLLEVQASDTAADRLRHRRANLPERAELAATGARAVEVQARLAGTRAQRAEVLATQAKVDAAIGAAGERIKEIEGRLYSGQVSATRDILAMTAEVESIKTRRSSLEDDLMATMEAEEPLAAEVAELEGVLSGLEVEAARLLAVIAGGEGVIDAELAEVNCARQEQAAQLPADLLTTYEALRARLGGEGAARVSGRSCSGCHLTLPAQEVERIKRAGPDDLVLCDQCGRILVH
ncbi:MAG: zinc ribbon domain-containing protein [Acidimicrobiales bacterium]